MDYLVEEPEMSPKSPQSRWKNISPLDHASNIKKVASLDTKGLAKLGASIDQVIRTTANLSDLHRYLHEIK